MMLKNKLYDIYEMFSNLIDFLEACMDSRS